MSDQESSLSTGGSKSADTSLPEKPEEIYSGYAPVTKEYFENCEDFATMANEEYREVVAVEQATRKARQRIAERVAARGQRSQAEPEPSP